MSRSDRIQRNILRAARRAERLAERARRRSSREADRARRAASRAERLARRVAEDELGGRDEDLYGADEFYDDDDAYATSPDDDGVGTDEGETLEEWIDRTREKVERRYGRRRRSSSSSRRRASSSARATRRARRRRTRYRRGLYRDPDRARVAGICAGLADYLGVEVWHVRCCAVLGLVFLPQLTMSGYIIAWFVLDKKPYYQRVTDRYDSAMEVIRDAQGIDDPDEMDEVEDEEPMATRSGSTRRRREPRVSNATAMRMAREKFADLEGRVRAIETHVTSSQFELDRELNKISGENRA